jgi:hypothetical protein
MHQKLKLVGQLALNPGTVPGFDGQLCAGGPQGVLVWDAGMRNAADERMKRVPPSDG